MPKEYLEETKEQPHSPNKDTTFISTEIVQETSAVKPLSEIIMRNINIERMKNERKQNRKI